MNNPAVLYLMTLKEKAAQKETGIFLVGGFLRDMILKRESRDFDFAVEDGAVALAKDFAKTIRGAFVLLDRDHGCAKKKKKQGGKIWTFDFAAFRRDTLRKDLTCRDFTINTLSLDMRLWDGRDFLNGVRDYKGARRDLAAKRIRMVSRKVFTQDPLRLLRAFALRASLGFRIEKETLAQMKKDRELIRSVSAERVRDELFKIFESSRAGAVLKQMDRMGLLEYVIPHVRVMFGVKQGTYHHLNVWSHALETVCQIEKIILEFSADQQIREYLDAPVAGGRSRKALLKLACLLHDAGKPETRKRQGTRIRFHGHEHAGKKISSAAARHIKLSTRERHTLCDMVRLHLRPGYLSNFKRPGARAVFRYFRDTGDEAVSIALLAMADQRATCGPMTTAEDAAHHDKVCRGLIREYFAGKHEQPIVPLINGHDLIQILKLQSSPFFSKILRCVEEHQAAGKISTKEQALDLARTIIKKERKAFENSEC